MARESVGVEMTALEEASARALAEESYRAMAADKAREAEAMEWCNGIAGDMTDAEEPDFAKSGR